MIMDNGSGDNKAVENLMAVKLEKNINITFHSFQIYLIKERSTFSDVNYFFVKLLLQERYAMINVTPRSLHWLLRTFLLYAISRVFSQSKFF